MTQQRPIRASDFSGVYDPTISEVVQRPDFERMRRAARLGPEDPGYNPNSTSLEEIDRLERQWDQQHSADQ